MDPADRPLVERIVRVALKEDLAAGDATTDAFVPADARAKGALEFRQAAVVCGLAVAHLVFDKVDKNLVFKYATDDGDAIGPGDTAATVLGRARSLMKAERTALNLLQRMCGIATMTRAFVEALPGIEVYDTRKTTPGLRVLEKYAVRVGGGHNHRADLSQIMIKDNHIEAAGADAIAAQLATETRPVIAEATTVEMAERWAAFACVRRVMLDNMPADAIRDAVMRLRRVREGLVIEVSGGVTLATAAALRDTGIDAVSVGALTHSVPAVDIGLELSRI